MKEENKNLLNEITHLTRLIKNNEKLKHIPKKPTNYTYFKNNDINFKTAPSSAPNKYKYSKPANNRSEVLVKNSAIPVSTSTSGLSSMPLQSKSSIVHLPGIPTTAFINPLFVPPTTLSMTLTSPCRSQISMNTSWPNLSAHGCPKLQMFQNLAKYNKTVAHTSDNWKLTPAKVSNGGNPYKYKKVESTPVNSSTSRNTSNAILVNMGKTTAPGNSLFTKKAGDSFTSATINAASQTDSNESKLRITRNAINLTSKIISVPIKSNYKLDRRIQGHSHQSINTYGQKRELKIIAGRNSSGTKYIVKPYSIIERSPKRKQKLCSKIIRRMSVGSLKSFKCGRTEIVKIQGTAYESKNKGKTLKRIRTTSLTIGETLRTSTKILASQVLKKSKHTLIKSRQKKNVFCRFYCLFGICKKFNEGICKFVHDRRQVFVCSKLIVGKCDNEKCTLSHNLENGKIPPCRFFKKGRCTRTDCLYSHGLSRKNQLKAKQANVDVSLNKKEATLVAKNPTNHESVIRLTEKEPENARYYIQTPEANPLVSVIPRRLPAGVAKCVQESESDSDNTNATDSESNSSSVTEVDSDNQYNSVGDSESSSSESESDSSDDDTDCESVHDSANHLKSSQHISTTNESNLLSPDSQIPSNSDETVFPNVPKISITPTILSLNSSSSSGKLEENFVSDKRQRLLKIQANLKNRVALIRNGTSTSDHSSTTLNPT